MPFGVSLRTADSLPRRGLAPDKESGKIAAMLKSARIVLLAMICFCFAEPGMTQRKQPPTTDAVSAPIGLQIGEKAPEFAATDQFGREQSNETLRGAEGTVLLFFRSADW